MLSGKGIQVKAHAKINLTLEVLSKREDGYHNIISVMQSISLHDLLHLVPSNKGIKIYCGHPRVPNDESNLAYKAAEKLLEYTGIKKGVEIRIKKGIPVAAGLGGGSADAAGVLLGLNKLWDLGIHLEDLSSLGMGLGADVPFCIYGGTALARGIGEKITPLPTAPKLDLILIKPPFGLSAGDIYKAYDKMTVDAAPNHQKLMEGLDRNDTTMIVDNVGNMLQAAAVKARPKIQDLVDILKGVGCPGVFMSGSGPTVCGVVESDTMANDIMTRFSHSPMEVFLATTVGRGVCL